MGESDGVADIQIGVIEGSLRRPVAVQFSTSADSATGKLTAQIMQLHRIISPLIQLALTTVNLLE